MSNAADEAIRKFRHRAVTTQAARAVTGQSKKNWTTPNFRTTVALAGEEQEELLHVQRSSVGDVACSIRKDTVMHRAKSVKGVSAKITSSACVGAYGA